jgi:UDP-3-O-[3-hydroxymyristoyl] glucosamine N-acyltransferase
VPAFTVAEIAARCGGRVVGDGALRISGVRALQAAGPSDLSFVADAKAERKVPDSRAGAILARDATRHPGRTVVEAADPSLALAAVLDLFFPRRAARPGVHPSAIVEPGATVDPSAEIGPFAVVGEGSRIGAGAIVEAHAVLGRGCTIGPGTRLHPHVVLYDGVALGARTEIHSGAVLGADGFGYAPTASGIVKVPQVGGVTVDDDVEIGANSCVDRATLEQTRVGAGSKIDDLVMIGHNSTVGRHVILCGQVGLAGSTVVGDGAVLAGQVGVAGHLTIGPGAKAGAQAGIAHDVPAGETVFGTPEMSHREALRAYAELRRLPETARALRELLARAATREEETP